MKVKVVRVIMIIKWKYVVNVGSLVYKENTVQNVIIIYAINAVKEKLDVLDAAVEIGFDKIDFTWLKI